MVRSTTKRPSFLESVGPRDMLLVVFLAGDPAAPPAAEAASPSVLSSPARATPPGFDWRAARKARARATGSLGRPLCLMAATAAREDALAGGRAAPGAPGFDAPVVGREVPVAGRDEAGLDVTLAAPPAAADADEEEVPGRSDAVVCSKKRRKKIEYGKENVSRKQGKRKRKEERLKLRKCAQELCKESALIENGNGNRAAMYWLSNIGRNEIQTRQNQAEIESGNMWPAE